MGVNLTYLFASPLSEAHVGPLTLKFDRATQPFLKIDRRH